MLIAWKGDNNKNLNIAVFDYPKSKFIFNSPHPTETSDKAPSLGGGDITLDLECLALLGCIWRGRVRERTFLASLR